MLFILVPYSKRSSFRGSPRRAEQIYTLLAKKRRVEIVYRPTLWPDQSSAIISILEHLLFYVQVFSIFLLSKPSTSFLCITQESAFPILPALLILSRKVTVDIHGLFISEHHALLRSSKNINLGLKLLILGESILFRSNKVSFILLTTRQRKFIRSPSQFLILNKTTTKILPFILPDRPLNRNRDIASFISCPKILYFGGAQSWQGLDLLDDLIQCESPVLKYIFLHGTNPAIKYSPHKHLFGGVSTRIPDHNDFSYGLSFRSYNIRNSRFNFSSKIAYYISHDLIPLVPITSSEACIAIEFGGSTFSYDPSSFADFIDQIVSEHTSSFQKRLMCLRQAYADYSTRQSEILNDT